VYDNISIRETVTEAFLPAAVTTSTSTLG